MFERVTYVNPNDAEQDLWQVGIRYEGLEQCVSGDWARVMVEHQPATLKAWVGCSGVSTITYTSDVIRLFDAIFFTKFLNSSSK